MNGDNAQSGMGGVAVVDDGRTYCYCKKTIDEYDEDDLMIECDECKEWFHGRCVSLKPHDIADIETYVCVKCQNETNNRIIYKERKNFHRHDYADENAENKPIQAGTVLFTQKLLEKEFYDANGVILKLHGSQLTKVYLEKFGFTKPILVENQNGLNIKVPKTDELSIREIVSLIGKEYKLDVIDVERQEIINITIDELNEYFEKKQRSKIYNLLSLEISKTKLDELIDPPALVHEISWVSNGVWPGKLPDTVPYTKPEVQKYCLLSAKGSYTDFHVDFGGSSVWYHCLKGSKYFYLIEPNEKNLAKYEKWSGLKNHTEVFLPDQIDDKCYKLTVNEGNTIFLPAGWIHAVYTPSDSIVFGGNFEHFYSVPLQVKIYEMENRLKIPDKYRFPGFQTLHWYAGKYFVLKLKQLNNERTCAKKYLYNGCRYLRDTLKKWLNEPKYYELHGHEIPYGFNCDKLISIMNRELRKASILLKEKEYKPNNIKTKNLSTDSGIQMLNCSPDLMAIGNGNKKRKSSSSSSTSTSTSSASSTESNEFNTPKIPKLILKLPKSKGDHVSIKEEEESQTMPGGVEGLEMQKPCKSLEPVM